jgi:antitoxin VapB
MKTRSFKSGNSTAIRIPKQFGMKVGEVMIHKLGDTIIIQKPQNSWEALFASLKGGVSEDFMNERIQPPLDQREPL